MKTRLTAIPTFILLAAFVLVQAPARAAPLNVTVEVNSEPGGDIDLAPADGVFENSNGAFFWNGSQWKTDSTAVHTYYTDPVTHQRLKNYTLLATLDGSGAAGVVFDQWGYTVTQSTYSYFISRADHHGFYHYQAVQYSIATILPREKYILRSRGTGNGTALGYLDVYIQEDSHYTVAFRGDPFMFSYDNATAEQAVDIASDSQELSASLPTYTPATRAQYWLDINGGSDLGGASFFFKTSQITPVLSGNLGSSFPSEFRVKFMDSNSQLEEFIILPRIISETLIPPINLYLPIIRR